MTCYEINKEYEALISMLAILDDSEDSEMEDLAKQQLEELNHTTESKLENMTKMIRNMELEALNYKAEIDRMTKNMKAINKRVDFIKNELIKPIIEKSGKIKAGVFTVSLRKSQAVNIIDSDLVDEKYIIQQAVKINKTQIKKDLKNGFVNGAELITNQSVQIK